MKRGPLADRAQPARWYRLRTLLALLAMWAFGTAVHAQRVEMLYLGTSDCSYCRAWEARSKPLLLASPEGKALTYIEVRGETLRRPITREHYPPDYAWAYEQVGPSRGVPRFLLFVDRKLAASAFGLTAYERDFLPALRALLARPATSAGLPTAWRTS